MICWYLNIQDLVHDKCELESPVSSPYIMSFIRRNIMTPYWASCIMTNNKEKWHYFCFCIYSINIYYRSLTRPSKEVKFQKPEQHFCLKSYRIEGGRLRWDRGSWSWEGLWINSQIQYFHFFLIKFIWGSTLYQIFLLIPHIHGQNV